MLDQKGAWDAFITSHAPTGEIRDTLLHELGHYFGLNEDELRDI